MGSPAAPLHELDCALSGPGLHTAKARKNPVEDYVETQGRGGAPHPRDGQEGTSRKSQPGEAGPARSPCPQTLPVTVTDSALIRRSNHPSRAVTMRDLRHSLPADHYQAHAPIPSETRLDKYLLRWFLEAGDRPSRTSGRQIRTKTR